MTVIGRQSSIKDWVEHEIIPEGRKGKSPPKGSSKVRRVRGKLSKKEQEVMKATHRDISHLLVKQPPAEMKAHEECIEKEPEYDVRQAEIEKEERLQRMRRRAKEWEAVPLCRSLTTEVVEEAQRVSDREMGKQMVEVVLEMAWETIDVNRIVRETLAGSVDMVERIKAALGLVEKSSAT